MRYQALRGTNDILPYQASRSEHTFDSCFWQFLEQAFLRVSSRFGYEEIRTPILELTDLFVRSSGDTSEIVSKQMYSFLDKGDREVSMKPEGTAPVMRAYLEHSLGAAGSPTRLCYFTHIFRYERPQKGRYRQAHQVGVELIGSPTPAADVEVIEVACRFYEEIGLRDLTASVNCIGREADRARYGEAVLAQVQSYLKDQSEEFRAQATKNPLRLLDTKVPELRAALDGLAPVLDFVSDESRAHFDQVQAGLTEAGIAFQVDPSIVRGLDYYTDTVFEVHSTSLGAQSTLCGGGRYDNLIDSMGGKSTPSVGFGAGIERALIVLEAQGLLPEAPRPDFVLVNATPGATPVTQRLARELRAAGFSAITDVDGRSLKSQLKAADRLRARYAIIVGDDEIGQGTATVRDLASSQQIAVAQDHLVGQARSGFAF